MITAHTNTDVSDAEWNIPPLSLEKETRHVTDFSLLLTITTLKRKRLAVRFTLKIRSFT